MSFLHPFVVHFAIALLSVSVVTDLLYLLTKKENLDQIGSYLLFLGTGAAILAVLSGNAAQEVVTIPVEITDLVETHEWSGTATLIIFALLSIMRVVMIKSTNISKVVRNSYYVIAVIGAAMLFRTGLLGGEMVYIHGVGIEPGVERHIEKPSFED